MESKFSEGLRIRKEVLGAEYVEASLNRPSFMGDAFQTLVTEWCWGSIWSRPGLERRTRSMINIAMLTALGKPDELRLHVRGAVNNGVTQEEIREVILQATIYCGVPAGLEAVRVADAVLGELAQAGPAAE